jgi:osmotically-inducible protein OsmY
MNVRKVSIAALAAALVLGTGAAVANGSEHPVKDSVITTKVKAELVKDDTTKARHINVTTKNGVVKLSGSVGSETEKDQAAADAQAVDGVVNVENELTVKVQ